MDGFLILYYDVIIAFFSNPGERFSDYDYKSDNFLMIFNTKRVKKTTTILFSFLNTDYCRINQNPNPQPGAEYVSIKNAINVILLEIHAFSVI